MIEACDHQIIDLKVRYFLIAVMFDKHTHIRNLKTVTDQTWRPLLFNYVYSTVPHLSPAMAPDTIVNNF